MSEMENDGKDLIEEARGLAALICPMQFQLEDGDAIERMPDDLLRAANIIGRLCDALATARPVGLREKAMEIERAQLKQEIGANG